MSSLLPSLSLLHLRGHDPREALLECGAIPPPPHPFQDTFPLPHSFRFRAKIPPRTLFLFFLFCNLYTVLQLLIYKLIHRVHRVVSSAFWRTFSHEGKICLGWWGWGGARPPPFITFTITSKVAMYAPAEWGGQIH
jgi:hypothetical protein